VGNAGACPAWCVAGRGLGRCLEAGTVSARLQFDLPGFAFRSRDVQLVERQEALQVFEGSGTVGSKDGYRFRLGSSVTGGGSESGRFGLKIWHTDPASGKEVIDYDNATAASGPMSRRVTGGSIVQD